MEIFNTILIQPIINILVAFYHVFLALHIPYALGFAIIALTVLIRFLMYPFTAKQLELSKKMQDIAPHLSKVKEKHKNDAKRQQEAMMALYREHNVNPAAGCLPGLIQIVILVFGLYPALQKILTISAKETVSTINGMLYSPMLNLSQPWDTNFLGLRLEKTPGDLFASLGVVVLLVPLLTGIFQFVQSKMMYVTPPPAKNPQAKGSPEDFAATFQKQTVYLLPIMIGVFAYTFSVGLSLYWNTFTIFGIIQQYKMQGWGGMTEVFQKLQKGNKWKITK